jgi:hypothetical protein
MAMNTDFLTKVRAASLTEWNEALGALRKLEAQLGRLAEFADSDEDRAVAMAMAKVVSDQAEQLIKR